VAVTLDGDGACVLLDGFTAGRVAFGERWAMEGLDLRTTVSMDGRPIVADALRLERADGSIAGRAGSFDAFATLLAIGSGVAPITTAIHDEAVDPPTPDVVSVSSPLPRASDLGVSGALLRVAARTPSGAMAAVRSRLRNLPDIDIVDPFTSRF
jgi:urease accessory protein UreH